MSDFRKGSYWVCFSGKADVPFLRVFHRGFRHCFAIVRTDGPWLVFDPMFHCTELTASVMGREFDLPNWLRSRGYRVEHVPAWLKPRKRICFPMPYTCVEAVKRLIGLQDWKVFTPYQLYKKLHKLQQMEREHG